MAIKDEDVISLDPDDAEQGGGLPSDIDVKYSNCRFRVGRLSNYNEDGDPDDGSSTTLFSATLTPTGGGVPFDMHLSCGAVTRLLPSDDGDRLVAVPGSGARGLNTGSNYYLHVVSLKDAGFPMARLKAASSLDGLVAHIVRKPQPRREGLVAKPEAGERKFVATVPLVTSIVTFPWEAKGGKSAPAVKGAGTAAAGTATAGTPTPAGSADTEAVEAIKSLLASKQYRRGIPGDDIYKAVFGVVKSSPNRKAVLAAVQAEDFFERNSDVLAYDGETVTAAE